MKVVEFLHPVLVDLRPLEACFRALNVPRALQDKLLGEDRVPFDEIGEFRCPLVTCLEFHVLFGSFTFVT